MNNPIGYPRGLDIGYPKIIISKNGIVHNADIYDHELAFAKCGSVVERFSKMPRGSEITCKKCAHVFKGERVDA